MRYKPATAGVVAVALVLSTLSLSGFADRPADAATAPATWPLANYDKVRANDNVILKWNQQLLDSITANPGGTGPTVTARALAVLQTATYDAWAAYDPIAKGTRLGSTLRRPAAERTDANKSKAISFAAYKTLSWLFPGRESTYKAQLDALYPHAATEDQTPVKVGNTAAQAVIDYRSTDGSNQANGYTNTTTYASKNTWNSTPYPWNWQPLCVLKPDGVAAGMPPTPTSGDCPTAYYTIQKPLTPQWGNVTPFSLAPSQYQVYGPPKNADGTYQTADIDRALTETANLDDQKKAQAEYWADGPGSVFPPGHDFIFAGAVSRKYGYSLDTDVKLYFALGNAMMDASIAAWYQKYKWDFVRPISAIRVQMKGRQVTSWKGPGKGYGPVDGSQWMPYQSLTVVTPAFPEYVSGHSSFSGAGMAILSWMTGGNTFGATVTVPKGSSTIEAGVPAADVTFSLPTWSQTGEDAGTSRRIGGIHFYTGDINGRALGRQVATYVYAKANDYINGRTAG
jgi:uncharacterized protein DUF6851/vanadium-dependent haloperoxidase-like protein